jgi:hypothetical protein
VDRDADAEVHLVALPHLVHDRAERLEQVEAGLHAPSGVVLVGDGVTEVGEHAVADEAGDPAVVAPHHAVTGDLVAAEHLPDELRVVGVAEGRGAHDVAEHHGQLAPLTCGRGDLVGALEQRLRLAVAGRQGQRGAREVPHRVPIAALRRTRGVDQQVPDPIVVPPTRHGGQRTRASPLRRW